MDSCIKTDSRDPGWCYVRVGSELVKEICRAEAGACLYFLFKPNNVLPLFFVYLNTFDTDLKVLQSYLNNLIIWVHFLAPIIYGTNGQPCIFPIEDNGKFYEKSCVSNSIYDPGWCYTLGSLLEPKILKTNCSKNGLLLYIFQHQI